MPKMTRRSKRGTGRSASEHRELEHRLPMRTRSDYRRARSSDPRPPPPTQRHPYRPNGQASNGRQRRQSRIDNPFNRRPLNIRNPFDQRCPLPNISEPIGQHMVAASIYPDMPYPHPAQNMMRPNLPWQVQQPWPAFGSPNIDGRGQSPSVETQSRSDTIMPEPRTRTQSRQVWDSLDNNQLSLDPSNQLSDVLDVSADTIWQTMGQSRQVWDSLDINQLSLDPRNQLSDVLDVSADATWQTMGQSRLVWDPLDQLTNNETHLTQNEAQARVTNGTTGDGYYVRSPRKKTPTVLPQPQSLLNPTASYWDMLYNNQELEEMQRQNQTMREQFNNIDLVTDFEDLAIVQLPSPPSLPITEPNCPQMSNNLDEFQPNISINTPLVNKIKKKTYLKNPDKDPMWSPPDGHNYL